MNLSSAPAPLPKHPAPEHPTPESWHDDHAFQHNLQVQIPKSQLQQRAWALETCSAILINRRPDSPLESLCSIITSMISLPPCFIRSPPRLALDQKKSDTRALRACDACVGNVLGAKRDQEVSSSDHGRRLFQPASCLCLRLAAKHD